MKVLKFPALVKATCVVTAEKANIQIFKICMCEFCFVDLEINALGC